VWNALFLLESRTGPKVLPDADRRPAA